MENSLILNDFNNCKFRYYIEYQDLNLLKIYLSTYFIFSGYLQAKKLFDNDSFGSENIFFEMDGLKISMLFSENILLVLASKNEFFDNISFGNINSVSDKLQVQIDFEGLEYDYKLSHLSFLKEDLKLQNSFIIKYWTSLDVVLSELNFDTSEVEIVTAYGGEEDPGEIIVKTESFLENKDLILEKLFNQDFKVYEGSLQFNILVVSLDHSNEIKLESLIYDDRGMNMKILKV